MREILRRILRHTIVIEWGNRNGPTGEINVPTVAVVLALIAIWTSCVMGVVNFPV